MKSLLCTVSAPGECPLKEEPWPIEQWVPGSKRTGLIARKIGVVPLWMNDGKKHLSTMLQVCEQNVIDYLPPDVMAQTRFGFKAKGHGCLIVGAESRDPNRFSQEYLNLFLKSGVAPKKKLARFLVTHNAALQPGTPLFAGHFRAGQFVNVYGKTIDRGWMGACRRWGMKGGNATHGTTKSHFRAGAMGGPRGRILKGKKMGGHEGCERCLRPGLQVLRINYQYGVIYVKGAAVPGATGSFVQIYDTMAEKKRAEVVIPDNMPPFPTYFPEPEKPLPEEVWAPLVHHFNEPSIVFQEEAEVKRKLKVKARAKAAGKR